MAKKRNSKNTKNEIRLITDGVNQAGKNQVTLKNKVFY